MRTKDRKRQIKQYQKKLKIVNSYYNSKTRDYDNKIKELERKLELVKKGHATTFHELYTCEKAVLAFAKFLKRTGNNQALKELNKMFNLDDIKGGK